MCVALPGRIVEIGCADGPSIPSVVDLGHTTAAVDLAMVPDARVGDYVIAHSGFAIRVVPDTEVVEVRRLLAETPPGTRIR